MPQDCTVGVMLKGGANCLKEDSTSGQGLGGLAQHVAAPLIFTNGLLHAAHSTVLPEKGRQTSVSEPCAQMLKYNAISIWWRLRRNSGKDGGREQLQVEKQQVQRPQGRPKVQEGA